MNCAKHTEVPATAYCRTCGKAMCNECSRDVRGVIYCEQCIAERLSGTMPAGATAGAIPVDTTHAPSPGLAAMLGFVPGVGAVYNGQYGKGVIHLIAFVVLIAITNQLGSMGPVTIPVWFFFILYMVIDAHKTAKARLYGQPLPDPFGLNTVFGGTQHQTTMPPPPASAAYTQSNPNPNAYQAGFVPPAAAQGEPAQVYVEPAPRAPRAPVGAIVLIVIGFLFLLQSAGIFNLHWIGRMWPLILIALGLHIMWRRGYLGGR